MSDSSARFEFRLPKWLGNKISKHAKYMGESNSEYVRTAVQQRMEREPQAGSVRIIQQVSSNL